ncbi:MAG: hypothetical protein Kow0059_22660 [Candidatus Sumerlaeia bacterium]
MPVYDFACNSCQTIFEQRVAHFGDLAPCPQCGGTDVRRLISSAAVMIKGGGTKSEPVAECPSGMCSGMGPDGSCGMNGSCAMGGMDDMDDFD